jgi:hypothetical protein
MHTNNPLRLPQGGRRKETIMTDFPTTPESLVRETLQAVTLLRDLDEVTPGCLTVRRRHLDQIEEKLQLLLVLLTTPPTPAVVRKMRPLVQAIDRELDRLEWSSDTAPPGDECLDAFATNDVGIVALTAPYDTTCYHGAALLAILEALPEDTDWDTLGQAILPAMVHE